MQRGPGSTAGHHWLLLLLLLLFQGTPPHAEAVPAGAEWEKAAPGAQRGAPKPTQVKVSLDH